MCNPCSLLLQYTILYSSNVYAVMSSGFLYIKLHCMLVRFLNHNANYHSKSYRLLAFPTTMNSTNVPSHRQNSTNVPSHRQNSTNLLLTTNCASNDRQKRSLGRSRWILGEVRETRRHEMQQGDMSHAWANSESERDFARESAGWLLIAYCLVPTNTLPTRCCTNGASSQFVLGLCVQ